jgi:hypothetical protein
MVNAASQSCCHVLANHSQQQSGDVAVTRHWIAAYWGRLMIDLTALPIFPCNLAKEPLTAHGFKSAKRGARGWKGWPLVGFPTGAKSGFDVLDIDPRGRKWFDQNYDALPQTLAHSTQRGLHLLFKHAPGLRCSTNKIADGVDVRADGGYAIYWPTTGRVGCWRRRWARGLAPAYQGP